MKAESFEDLNVWQRARELCAMIYTLTKEVKFKRDYGLVDQIRRASVSVMSNIAEGFERGGDKEFIKFLYIAKASCGEVRSQLFVAFDQGYINQERISNAQNLAKQVSGMLSNLITYLRGSRGQKVHKP